MHYARGSCLVRLGLKQHALLRVPGDSVPDRVALSPDQGSSDELPVRDPFEHKNETDKHRHLHFRILKLRLLLMKSPNHE
jgi:hypothetical protein